ncbi:MAG: hypothetical protein AVDCRST_MAG13-3220, partial [uncultured Solirubrobacteraceae bacterium]
GHPGPGARSRHPRGGRRAARVLRHAAEGHEPGRVDLRRHGRVRRRLRHEGARQGAGHRRRRAVRERLHGARGRHAQAAGQGLRAQGDRQGGGRHGARAHRRADRL